MEGVNGESTDEMKTTQQAKTQYTSQDNTSMFSTGAGTESMNRAQGRISLITSTNKDVNTISKSSLQKSCTLNTATAEIPSHSSTGQNDKVYVGTGWFDFDHIASGLRVNTVNKIAPAWKRKPVNYNPTSTLKSTGKKSIQQAQN